MPTDPTDCPACRALPWAGWLLPARCPEHTETPEPAPVTTGDHFSKAARACARTPRSTTAHDPCGPRF